MSSTNPASSEGRNQPSSQSATNNKKGRRFSVTTYGKDVDEVEEIRKNRELIKIERKTKMDELEVMGQKIEDQTVKVISFTMIDNEKPPVDDHINFMLEVILQHGLVVKKVPRQFPYIPQERILILSAMPPRIVCCRPGHALRGNYSKGLDICEIEKIELGIGEDEYPSTAVFDKAKASKACGKWLGKAECCLSIIAHDPVDSGLVKGKAAQVVSTNCGGGKNHAIASHRHTIDIMVGDEDQKLELATALALYIQKLRPKVVVDEGRVTSHGIDAEKRREIENDTEQSKWMIKKTLLPGFSVNSFRTSRSFSPRSIGGSSAVQRSTPGSNTLNRSGRRESNDPFSFDNALTAQEMLDRRSTRASTRSSVTTGGRESLETDMLSRSRSRTPTGVR
mmetsp:Transcript_36689/g.46781  ORF Transcript_36689/g.46781 Transcript_36689/m.46781 type:complete len:394 (-) Transcript_36689:265-1446(-)